MKKITILFPALFMGFAMFGQTGVTKKQITGKPLLAKELTPLGLKSKNDGLTAAKSAGNQMKAVTTAPFFTNDFSNPALWDLSNHIGGAAWVIGTTGPGGPSSSDDHPITSTTAANGFALFDSDLLGQSGTPTAGDEDAYLSLVAPINCAGHSHVILSFQEAFKYYAGDSTFLEVSADNFTWNSFTINPGLAQGGWSDGYPAATVNTVNVDISAVAGSQATVYIRFRWSSLSANGGGWGYSWQVDDISLVDQPANDIAFGTTGVFPKAFVNFSKFGEGFYTQIPQKQTGFMFFNALVSNLGSANQSQAVLTVDVSDGSGSVFTTSSASAPKDLPVGSVDSSLVAIDYTDNTTIGNSLFMPPAAHGTYTATFTIAQVETEGASELVNNTATSAPFTVNDSVFAHDGGTYNGYCSPNLYTGGETEGIMGTTYFVNNADTATSVSVMIHSLCTYGMIQAEIYEVDTVAGALVRNLVGSSIVHTVDTLTELSTWVTLAVKNGGLPVQLKGGYQYLTAIHTTGTDYNAGTYIILGDDGSLLQQNYQSWVSTDQGASFGYTSSKHPMIRLNTLTDISIGVKDIAKNNGITVSQSMPNPTKGLSTINYSLDKNATITLAVYDVTGKKVASQNEGSQIAGTHSIKFNAEDLNAGVYYYSLSVNGNTASTMKMVVIK
jgi:hypothetical protein